MIKWIKSLFSNRQEELEKEVKILREKLDERQEVINKTNAYWKKKLHDMQVKSKSKKNNHDI